MKSLHLFRTRAETHPDIAAERLALEIARETGNRRLLLIPVDVLADAVLRCQEERLTAVQLGDLLAHERGMLDVEALEDAVEEQESA